MVLNNIAGRRVHLSARIHVVKDQKDAVENEIVRYENTVLDSFIPYFRMYFAKHETMHPVEIKK